MRSPIKSANGMQNRGLCSITSVMKKNAAKANNKSLVKRGIKTTNRSFLFNKIMVLKKYKILKINHFESVQGSGRIENKVNGSIKYKIKNNLIKIILSIKKPANLSLLASIT